MDVLARLTDSWQHMTIDGTAVLFATTRER
jgi:hypothetical protein